MKHKALPSMAFWIILILWEFWAFPCLWDLFKIVSNLIIVIDRMQIVSLKHSWLALSTSWILTLFPPLQLFVHSFSIPNAFMGICLWNLLWNTGYILLAPFSLELNKTFDTWIFYIFTRIKIFRIIISLLWSIHFYFENFF